MLPTCMLSSSVVQSNSACVHKQRLLVQVRHHVLADMQHDKKCTQTLTYDVPTRKTDASMDAHAFRILDVLSLHVFKSL